jgi:hypothetical protein
MTPMDDIIGPIVEALAEEISSIVGIGRLYTELPDGPPENNSVLFPLTGAKLEGDTNGKVYVRLTFSIRYVVRRGKFIDSIKQCYFMFSAFAKVLSSIPNQTLGGDSIMVTPKNFSINQTYDAAQAFVMLVMNVEVLTEFNLLQE